jgi:hypothetical protein
LGGTARRWLGFGAVTGDAAGGFATAGLAGAGDLTGAGFPAADAGFLAADLVLVKK